MSARTLRLLVACGALLASPSASAQTSAPPGDEGATHRSDAAASPESDPLGARLRTMVEAYYGGIGEPPTASELDEGLRAIQLLLLDGVSLDRVQAAVEVAIRLHTPGRRVPFQVAVPLRVQPKESGRGSTSTTSDRPHGDGEGDTLGDAPPPPPRGLVEQDPEAAARWAARQEELKARRNRLRLYHQWRDRTRERRALLGVGVPLLVGSWAATFAASGLAITLGEVPPSVGWTGAIPVAGPFVFGALTGGAYPAVFVLGAFQGIGLAFTIVGLARPLDLPYDRDPTALRLGRDPRTGRAILSIAPRPMGNGAALVGRF